ncbi:phosphoglycerate dehydrogenase [Nesterenkonia sp. NBAIMH1]|uniref:phosphoglycerate dehydrogenase n=1 Tax=Nesterenkonia sp. NBAIMH1 TaxID=2600320 RepID=UPI0011B7F190|nr:phosphoglycerate dehydrogenase [Nesterenkonia sp. NBAIMH1]
MKLLITPTSLSRQPDHPALDVLREAGAELAFNPHGRPMTPEELAVALQGVKGVIAGLDEFSAETLSSAPELRVIARYGVGYDRIDLSAAQQAGIRVTNAPGANGHSVAELALGLMLSTARQIPQTSAAVAAGEWPRFQGIELAGRTLGVLGMGFIGRSLASMAAGIGMEVRGFDPGLTDEQMVSLGVTPAGQEEIFSQCHVISLHIPLNQHTRGLVSAERIAVMPRGGIIINTARGGLLDEQAAVEALDSGQLHGIGLDAYESEPPTGSPLIGHSKVVATPHSGAHSEESVARTASAAVESLLAVLRGEEPAGAIV